MTTKTLRRGASGLLALAVAATLVTGAVPAYGDPARSGPADRPILPTADPEPDGTPTLAPDEGAYLTGTVSVTSEPTVADDSVVALAVDGDQLDATGTTGESYLEFDVGTNAAGSSFGNHLVVNGDHRIDLPTVVDERARIAIPNEHLVAGENTITVRAGARDGTSCGTNYDDFVFSDLQLELLGETADDSDNEFTYSFGDGSCGSNTSKVLEAELTFTVDGDPQRTTGLATELDTTTLDNGPHEITATTASGVTVTHTVRVNNAPAGAPRISPVDGTLTNGVQPVIAALAAGRTGSVTALTIDGEEPQARETLTPGTATLAFDVGDNSIEARYFNHLLVNGHQVEIGGDWEEERVEVAVPNHFLVPGDNTVTVVAGDVNGTAADGTTCANLDDFDLSNIVLTPASGTANPVGVRPTYAMGDGTCGSNPDKLAEADLTFTVDGAETATLRPTLGGGEATVSMYIGGNGATDDFGNVLRINGMEIPLDETVEETVTVVFPNQWLHAGTNIIEIVAGGNPESSCGTNYDDFPVSDLELTPASGTAALDLRQTRANGDDQPIRIGDGNCGSSHTGVLVAAVPFTVDAPTAGLRVDVDTATLPDGEHTVSATSDSGESATRTLVTDNTAPEVVDSVPAGGDTLREPTVFEVEVADASGLLGTPVYLLDGDPLAPGDVIGPGLGAGEHTIEVEAEDSLGNKDTRRITFTSAGIPAIPTDLSPTDRTREATGTVSLEARVNSPDGGQVTATFTEASVVNPTEGFAGTTSELPTTREVAGEESVDVAGLVPLDGETVDAPSTRDITFQRYTLPVGDTDRVPVVRWSGTIDPERIATLRLWDTAAGEWTARAASRGVFEGTTTLAAKAPDRFVDGDEVHVLVTGEDPFADDMEGGDPEAFADPSSYDFSMVHYTDTQFLSEGAVEQETEAERAIWKKAYGDITRWIADNAQERRIAHVMHTGDITQNNINPHETPADEELSAGEFQVASDVQAILDEAGIPSQVLAGNHDNQRGLETGRTSTFNDYFGPRRYKSADDQWGTAEYGGPWRPGDNQNNYVLFTAGGLDFIAVALSYGVTKEEAGWADALLKEYSDRNAILLTHDYLQPSTQADGRNSPLAGDGSAMYRLLVEPNPNVFLIMAGHRHGVGTNVKPEVGEVGHGVVELLADYQAYTVSADEVGLAEVGGYAPDEQLRFGASFLRLLQVDVDRSELIVDTYSPFLDDHGATEHQGGNRSYDGTEDEMVLPIDLTTRKTSFSTDGVALFVPGAEIGTDTVASGEVASVDWTGLVAGTTYAWMVTSEAAGGGRTVTEPGIFRTRGKTEPVLALVDDEVERSEAGEVAVEVSADGEQITDGTVELRDGDTVLGSADVADGVATVRLDERLPIGRHELVASYSGGDWVADAETTLTLTVTKAPVVKRTSKVRAKPVRKRVKVGQRIAARIRVQAGRPLPTGKVVVRRAGKVLAQGRLRNGRVVLRWRATPKPGIKTYRVRYLGSPTVKADVTRIKIRVKRR